MNALNTGYFHLRSADNHSAFICISLLSTSFLFNFLAALHLLSLLLSPPSSVASRRIATAYVANVVRNSIFFYQLRQLHTVWRSHWPWTLRGYTCHCVHCVSPWLLQRRFIQSHDASYATTRDGDERRCSYGDWLWQVLHHTSASRCPKLAAGTSTNTV